MRYWIVALTVGFALVGACGKHDAARTRPAPLVSVRKIVARDVAIEARAPVDLRPLWQSDIGSKTLGYLDAVLVDRGDHVRRGQLLAIVRPSDLPDQLAAARSQLLQSQASAALARANAERAEALAPTGVVSKQEVEQATSLRSANEAAEQAVRSQIAALAVRLGETRIQSPLDGVVWQRRLDPGALVGQPTATGVILTIAQIDVMRVYVAVPELQATQVRVGMRAYVELDALPGRRFEGKVARISPGFDPATRTLEAEVRIPNPAGELKPGMYGRAAIVLDVHKGRPVLPAEAIQLSAHKGYVFVLDGEHVKRKEVTLGNDSGPDIEVLSGVQVGDEVVIAGADWLSDGSPVRVSRDVDPFSGAARTSTASKQ